MTKKNYYNMKWLPHISTSTKVDPLAHLALFQTSDTNVERREKLYALEREFEQLRQARDPRDKGKPYLGEDGKRLAAIFALRQEWKQEKK